jgi:hypothetical protein
MKRREIRRHGPCMERGFGAVPALRLRCKKEIWEKKEDEARDGYYHKGKGGRAVGEDRDSSKEEMDAVERGWAGKEEELKRIGILRQMRGRSDGEK